MKVAGMRELRANSAALLRSGEPVLVTRHGKVSGVYVPLDEPDRLPDDLRRELVAVLGRHLAKALEGKGVTERELTEDFHAYRQRRR
ncbi:MAG: type II toxin-antitoxin system Phd/YefM family antitoxin [Candidatus Binatia bacterium]